MRKDNWFGTEKRLERRWDVKSQWKKDPTTTQELKVYVLFEGSDLWYLLVGLHAPPGKWIELHGNENLSLHIKTISLMTKFDFCFISQNFYLTNNGLPKQVP